MKRVCCSSNSIRQVVGFFHILVFWALVSLTAYSEGAETRAKVMLGHNDEVFDVHFSPDSRKIATSDGDEVIVWDLEHNRQSLRVKGRWPQFSGDSNLIYLAGDDDVSVFSTLDGTEIQKVKIPRSKAIVRLSASKQGGSLFVVSGTAEEIPSKSSGQRWQTFYEVIALSAKNMKEVWRYQVPSGYRPKAIAVSELGDQIWLAVDQVGSITPDAIKLLVVDANTGKNLRGVTLRNVQKWGWSSTVEPGPQPNQIILGNENKVEIRSTISGEVVRDYLAHWLSKKTDTDSAYANQAVVVPNRNIIASGGRDRQVTIYNLSQGKVVARLRGHSHWVRGVAASPDGRWLASGGRDHKLILWDTDSWEKKAVFGGDAGMISSLYLSSQNNLVIESGYWVPLDGDTVARYFKSNRRVWDVTAGTQRYFSPDGACAVSLGSLVLPECPIKFDEVWPEPIKRWLDARTLRVLPDLNLPSDDEFSERLYTSSRGGKAIYFPGRNPYDSESRSRLMDVDLSSGKSKVQECTNCPPEYSVINSVNVSQGLGLWTGYVSDEESGSRQAVAVVNIKSGKINKVYELDDLLGGKGEWVVSKSYISESGKIIIDLYECCKSSGDDEVSRQRIVALDNDLSSLLWSVEGDWGESLAFVGFDEKSDSALIARGALLSIVDAGNGRVRWSFKGRADDVISGASILASGDIAYGTEDGVVRFSSKSGAELLSVYFLPEGEWLAVTPEGFFNSSSAAAEQMIELETQSSFIPLANFRDALFRPDIVRNAMNGAQSSGLSTRGKVTQLPPVITIKPVPSRTDEKRVQLKLSVREQGGGVGSIRVYLNDTAVTKLNVNSSRNEELVVPLMLAPGENKISVSASDKEGVVFSSPVFARVELVGKSVERPALHAIVIGINQFGRESYGLKYAVSDAKAVANMFSVAGVGFFGNVDVTLLTTPEETSKENILAKLKGLEIQSPNDLFLLYIATHGVVDDGKYYLLTSNVQAVTREALNRDAIAQEELKDALMNIPTTKKLVMLDACSAGALGGVISSAFASRGPGEDEAIKLLSRAVGSAVLSASGTREKALEGYKSHGLFTYVLLKGLNGEADVDDDGFINTLELSTFLLQHVRTISIKSFGQEQTPINETSGEAFPILPSAARRGGIGKELVLNP